VAFAKATMPCAAEGLDAFTKVIEMQLGLYHITILRCLLSYRYEDLSC
jgi:hypothetical protein